ncbi:MAG: hypothetical protein M1825_000881 [Sarcosagium campestre]|nr:MAG: hypothetical protein M1825_000881 [Sarcosagium campestre]
MSIILWQLMAMLPAILAKAIVWTTRVETTGSITRVIEDGPDALRAGQCVRRFTSFSAVNVEELEPGRVVRVWYNLGKAACEGAILMTGVADAKGQWHSPYDIPLLSPEYFYGIDIEPKNMILTGVRVLQPDGNIDIAREDN